MGMAEHPRNCQIIIERARHVNLLLVQDSYALSDLLDCCGFFIEPTFKVGHFIITDLYFILSHFDLLSQSQGSFEIISVSFDVDQHRLLWLFYMESLCPEALDLVIDAWVLGHVQADKALRVAQIWHNIGQHVLIETRAIEIDALNNTVRSH